MVVRAAAVGCESMGHLSLVREHGPSALTRDRDVGFDKGVWLLEKRHAIPCMDIEEQGCVLSNGARVPHCETLGFEI